VPPVAALAVGVAVGRLVSVGCGVAGVPVALLLAVGAGVAVVPPAGAVVVDEGVGVGVGVQATTGSTLFTFGFRAGPVICWVAVTPSGSFHRLEFAVFPPPPTLVPGPDALWARGSR